MTDAYVLAAFLSAVESSLRTIIYIYCLTLCVSGQLKSARLSLVFLLLAFHPIPRISFHPLLGYRTSFEHMYDIIRESSERK